jgi:succinate dehydrogenase / fumarate reductase membrane anchor subunit
MSYKMHWQAQRLTALLLAFIYPILLFSFYHLRHASYAEIIQTVSNPLFAILIIAVIAVALYHAILGLQVIAEDYIKSSVLRHIIVKILQMKAVIIFVFTLFFVIKIMTLGSQF